MKRRLLYYVFAAAAVGTILWACQKERPGGGSPDRPEPTLTVSEARDFFEYQFSQAAPYLSKVAGDKPVGMMPGDFTPLWDKARIGANSEMDGADVPIDPKFIFTAIYNRVSASGDTVREMVDVAQKLVVKKWRNTEEYEAFCYIASVVPTPEHYAKHRHSAAREFCYGGDKGRFSGFVMYRSLEGILVAIDNYRDGRLTRHDYFPRITEQNADSVQRVALLTTGDLTLQAGTPSAFRLGTEEDPWCADAITVCGQQTDRPPIIIWIPGSGPGWFPDPGEMPDYPNPGPGPNGDGGGSGSGPSSVSVPQVQQKDCGGTAGANAAGAQATLGTFNNVGLGTFINANIGRNVESGATLNYNSQTGQYSMANQKTDGSAHNIGQIVQYGGAETSIALVHTHPNSGMGPSIADVNALITADQSTGSTKTSFVVVNENGNPVTYALQLENPTQAKAFGDNCKANTQLNSRLMLEIDMVFQELNKKSGDTMGNSYSYALSAILQKYNTGVRVLKQEGNAFKQKECTISGDNINRSTCK